MAVVTLDGNVCTVGDAYERLRSRASRSCSRARSRSSCWATNQGTGRPRAVRQRVQFAGPARSGKPRNPFINAGALVVTDVLCRRFVKAETALVEFVRRLIGANDIDYDSRVAQSELQHAERNRAMAHFMASFGNMQMPPDTVIDAYCRQCAITMNCVERARRCFRERRCRAGHRRADRRFEFREAAVGADADLWHLRCGGDFVYRVGPPKAVSAAGSSRCCRARWPCACGRRPDANGNSLAGTLALEWLTTYSGRSIFEGRRWASLIWRNGGR